MLVTEGAALFQLLPVEGAGFFPVLAALPFLRQTGCAGFFQLLLAKGAGLFQLLLAEGAGFFPLLAAPLFHRLTKGAGFFPFLAAALLHRLAVLPFGFAVEAAFFGAAVHGADADGDRQDLAGADDQAGGHQGQRAERRGRSRIRHDPVDPFRHAFTLPQRNAGI